MMFPPVSCNNCEIIFAYSTSLRDHALHCRPTCGKCNRQFQYQSLLKRHQRNTRCNVVKRSKTVCNKCGSNFDVPATYTAHLKLCGDAGIYGSPSTSHQDPVDGQNRYMTKRRSKCLLSKRAEQDIFQVLTEVKSSSSHQLSVADLQRLVHIPHNGPVSLDTVKAIEVVTGLRIDVFTRSWSEDHHHYFVTQLHVSSQFDTTAPKIALHTPDPTNLRKINVIESMATYSGVHARRSVLQSRQMTEKWTIKSLNAYSATSIYVTTNGVDFQIMRSVVPSPLGAETSRKGLFERGPDQLCWWSVQHTTEHLWQAGLHRSLHTTGPQVVEIQGHLWHGVLSPSDPWGSKQSSHPYVRQCGQ